MTMIVLKYDLSVGDNKIVLRKNSKILCSKFQQNEYGSGIKLWVLTSDSETECETCLIKVVATGREIFSLMYQTHLN